MKRNDHLYFKSGRSIAGHSASLIIDPDGDSKEWATTQGAALGFMEDFLIKRKQWIWRSAKPCIFYLSSAHPKH